ncbi:hypothetical protein CO115_02300 [Candidatus Falkowbacteria bacterium CG_4_9_14_3_um_filter_36_9]|uniref:Uncharacterized protein n=2 Tax=Candidatus Falkowiibacteriota TaxID=1752728 RepID=A0A1J4T7G0_9BACT|nr:MAG: hypothetical protein AUJ27_02725 [Candidatus Falkowbacteria bacterium CG1_02_37_44]PIV51798.1 MAG: hypothetical protein COS18_01995 [Candidatus Falkowbacteria bacterium CG02_land_8_20_14_3_00_36_14]PIX11412.1 MAG: hypothetical protein COZ73_02710 [Candidatus Falkowbacteria bacterium CG_4_8_14_3_um_filter_36_11]PJA11009.1 MAG: hypothetical protein COX67_02015 [Candidatus Falkowbacteria bacterium CG_4_10_14_0_2_um_filter_36_22]PJB19773.1 MAG: hypothetical protein CO115_02300 [Candidatus F
MDLEKDYLGLINVKAFDAWRFVADLPDRTLFLSGRELLISLGLKDIYEKARSTNFVRNSKPEQKSANTPLHPSSNPPFSRQCIFLLVGLLFLKNLILNF